MKTYKNLTSIGKIKDFNLRLINKNFNLTDSEFGKMKKELMCDKGLCKVYNEKTLKSKNFIYCYLPLPTPKIEGTNKIKHFFICKEPSTKWANKNQNIAWSKVENGDNINFIGKNTKLKKLEILFIALYNVFKDENFYITDLSKCAINPSDVNKEKKNKYINKLSRYDCCQNLLKYEINKFTDEATTFYFIGDNTKENIKKYKLLLGNRKINHLPHYAIQISCPDHVNEMIYYYSEKIRRDEIIKEIFNGFYNLDKNLYNNFILDFEIKLLKKEIISPTYILLYLIYRHYFEKVKEERNIK